MKVILSSEAEKDLENLFSYINGALSNPIAAQNIVNKITRSSHKLSVFPELGVDLGAIDTRLHGLRYLIADNYLVVYKIIDQELFVLRILYARSNYAKVLLG